MRLAKLSEFRRTFYTEDSAPAETTLRRQIDRGQLPGGVKNGARYFIDLDEHARATNMRAELAAQHRDLARNPLLSGLV